MSPRVDCEDCAYSDDVDDLLEASDRAEEHEAKEHHRVSIERVATDGGEDDPLRSDDAPVARVFEQAADAVLDDRGESHGDIHDNFTQIADLWGDYLGVHVDPVDVAVMNVLQKISRSDAGSRKEDHFVDIAGYAAIANGLARSMPDEDCDTLATDGGRDYAWVVTCPHDERTVVEDDAEAAVFSALELYDVTIAGWDDPPSPRPIATDGGEPSGTRRTSSERSSDGGHVPEDELADEIEAEICSRIWDRDDRRAVFKSSRLAGDLDMPVNRFNAGLRKLRKREDARVEIERWNGQTCNSPWEATLAEQPAIADGGSDQLAVDGERTEVLTWTTPEGAQHRIVVEPGDEWEVVGEYRLRGSETWNTNWKLDADPNTGVFAHPALNRALEADPYATGGGAPGGAAAPPEQAPEPSWDERIHSEEDLYRDAEMEWGLDAQMAKAAEEFAELAAVCARDLNRQADGQVLLEELVDARIMLEQVAYQIDDDRLEETVEAKLAQLHARLHHGGDGDA